MKNPYTTQPAVVCTYSPPKLGKTVDTMYSFPRGLFLAQAGALKGSEHVVGFVPEVHPVATLAAATAEIRKQKPGVHDAVVVDDLSLLAERSLSMLETKLSGFQLFGRLRDEMIDLRDAARDAGMHVVFNAHEVAPRMFGNASLRGGPKLPGRMAEDFPAVCDVVLRAQYEPARLGWPFCYRCSPDDTQYVTGDRHGLTPDRAPMNLAEILRACGFALRRAPGLEWQDEVVASVARAALPVPEGSRREFLQAVVAGMKAKGRSDVHIRWVLRDALDRNTLSRLREAAAWSRFSL